MLNISREVNVIFTVICFKVNSSIYKRGRSAFHATRYFSMIYHLSFPWIAFTQFNASWRGPKVGWSAGMQFIQQKMYIPRWIIKNENFYHYVSLGILFTMLHGNWYLSRGRKKTYFPLMLLGMSLLLDRQCPWCHTTFGFCHDSLNLVNSAKIISGKLYCLRN